MDRTDEDRAEHDDHAPLTNDELAEIERDRDRALGINNPVGTSFVIIARYVPRLIADLRAARAEVERLQAQVVADEEDYNADVPRWQQRALAAEAEVERLRTFAYERAMDLENQRDEIVTERNMLRGEVERLRDALHQEWLKVHEDRCTNEWPHPEKPRCHYPLLYVLRPLTL